MFTRFLLDDSHYLKVCLLAIQPFLVPLKKGTSKVKTKVKTKVLHDSFIQHTLFVLLSHVFFFYYFAVL